MAKIKELVDGAEGKHPAKKTTKAKLNFPVGGETAKTTVKEAVIAEVLNDIPVTTPISAKKEIKTVAKPKVVDSADKLSDLMDEVFESPIPVPAAPAVKEVILPVEEKEVLDRNLKASASKSTIKPAAITKPLYNKDVKKSNGKELPPTSALYPEHMVNIALIIKNNAEIRRFTSLGILNYLLQKGEIKGGKRYVSFKWNKFTVKVDNLSKDYNYSEPFFINCLVAAFSSFASSAQHTIDEFTRKELNASIGNVASNEEIDNIVAANEKRN